MNKNLIKNNLLCCLEFFYYLVKNLHQFNENGTNMKIINVVPDHNFGGFKYKIPYFVLLGTTVIHA
jgi:hypothetical protein